MLKDLLDIKIEMNAVLEAIDAQLDELGAQARGMGCTIHQVKNAQGETILMRLLHTKAVALNGLIGIEAMTK